MYILVQEEDSYRYTTVRRTQNYLERGKREEDLDFINEGREITGTFVYTFIYVYCTVYTVLPCYIYYTIVESNTNTVRFYTCASGMEKPRTLADGYL